MKKSRVVDVSVCAIPGTATCATWFTREGKTLHSRHYRVSFSRYAQIAVILSRGGWTVYPHTIYPGWSADRERGE